MKLVVLLGQQLRVQALGIHEERQARYSQGLRFSVYGILTGWGDSDSLEMMGFHVIIFFSTHILGIG